VEEDELSCARRARRELEYSRRISALLYELQRMKRIQGRREAEMDPVGNRKEIPRNEEDVK